MKKNNNNEIIIMGTCGFWTIAFCIEAAKYSDIVLLIENCKNKNIFNMVAKRISIIIDRKDMISEEEVSTYEIPLNSICVPSKLKYNKGQRSEYCDKLLQMLTKLGPMLSND